MVTLELTYEELVALVDAIAQDSAADIAHAVHYGDGDERESLGQKLLEAAEQGGMDRDMLARIFGLRQDDETTEDW